MSSSTSDPFDGMAIPNSFYFLCGDKAEVTKLRNQWEELRTTNPATERGSAGVQKNFQDRSAIASLIIKLNDNFVKIFADSHEKWVKSKCAQSQDQIYRASADEDGTRDRLKLELGVAIVRGDQVVTREKSELLEKIRLAEIRDVVNFSNDSLRERNAFEDCFEAIKAIPGGSAIEVVKQWDKARQEVREQDDDDIYEPFVFEKIVLGELCDIPELFVKKVDARLRVSERLVENLRKSRMG